MDFNRNAPKCPFNMTHVDDDIINFLAKKIGDDVGDTSSGVQTLRAMSRYTVALPANCNPAVREVFVDGDTLDELTNCGVLNFSTFIMKLYPLKTPGDGNCLLHAASIAMWGLLDHTLLLRHLLYITLSQETWKSGSIEERWKASQLRRRAMIQNTFSIEYSSELQNSFNSIREAVAGRPGADVAGIRVEYLEPVHIFTLANVLKRPIVVVADRHVRAWSGSQLEENTFGGIYLPLLVPAEQCVKYPLVLAFNMYHFMPLVGEIDTEECLNYCVPLVYDRSLQPLPIQFLLPTEENRSRQLLDNYLKVNKIQEVSVDGRNPLAIPVAMLHHITVSALDLMAEYVKKAQASVSGISAVPNSPMTPGRQDNNPNRVLPTPAPNREQDASLMSAVNERCQFPGCDNFCSRNLLPIRYCYEHAFRDDTHVEQQQQQRIESRSGSLPSELRSQPARQRCIAANCTFQLPPGEGPYCHIHRGQLQQNVNGREKCKQCKTNRGKHQYQGICSHCYYRNVYGTALPTRHHVEPQPQQQPPPPPSSVPQPPPARQQQQLEVEMEQLRVPAVETCLSSGCTRIAGPAYMVGLCPQCHVTAMKHQQRMDNRQARQGARDSPPRVYACAVRGCLLPAESHRGFCPHHQPLVQLQEPQHTPAVILSSTTTHPLNRQHREPPADVTTAAHHLSSVQPCSQPQCRNDGIRELEGLCITCKAEKDRAMASGRVEAEVQTSLVVNLPSATSTNGVTAPGNQSTSAQQREPDTIQAKFVHSLRDVEEQSRSGAQRCVKPGCGNYGNSQRKGFCSTCYKQMHASALKLA